MPNTHTLTNGVTLSRDAFIAHYVAAWLASYTATHHVDYCQRGLHAELERPPVEDAVYLAETAWAEIERMSP